MLIALPDCYATRRYQLPSLTVVWPGGCFTLFDHVDWPTLPPCAPRWVIAYDAVRRQSCVHLGAFYVIPMIIEMGAVSPEVLLFLVSPEYLTTPRRRRSQIIGERLQNDGSASALVSVPDGPSPAGESSCSEGERERGRSGAQPLREGERETGTVR